MMEIPTTLLEEEIVKRGTILHSYNFDYIDHGKFFVIVGVSKEHIAGFFFINSNINKAIENKPEQYAMQYLLLHRDYKFLRHDSFVCATEIIKLHREVLAKSIKDGRTSIIGELKKEHLDDLLEKARQSRLFNKKEKEAFLF